MKELVGTCARDELERLKGFLSTGYALWSRGGRGGGSTGAALAAVLKALRMDAKDGFFVKGEEVVVLMEEWVECAKGVDGLRGRWRLADVCESSDVSESVRAWKYVRSARSGSAMGVIAPVGDSCPLLMPPLPNPWPNAAFAAVRPNGMGVEWKSSSSKSASSSASA